jgi:hypothetical protein
MKRSITACYLNLPYADLNFHAENSKGTQVFLNRPKWENGYTQVARGLTQRLPCPVRSMFTSCSNVQWVCDHCKVLMKVEWGEKCRKH